MLAPPAVVSEPGFTVGGIVHDLLAGQHRRLATVGFQSMQSVTVGSGDCQLVDIQDLSFTYSVGWLTNVGCLPYGKAVNGYLVFTYSAVTIV